jgi:membrane-associated phospholipid phosphatase
MQSSETQPLDECVAMAPSTAVRLRSSEWLIAAYFTCAIVLAVGSGRASATVPMLAVPALLYVVAYSDARFQSMFWSVLRDWLPTAVVLFAYLTLERFDGIRPLLSWDGLLLNFDRTLLGRFELRHLIESLGALGPSLLELCYSLLYCVPHLAVGTLYLCRRRGRVDQFHFTFLLGTLMAYSLLPHFPLPSPRSAFPGVDLPSFDTIFRQFNVWLLDSFDIHTSVFPSGHVAVGFSCAFAMWRALPEKRWFSAMLFMHATLVFVATFYSRYHYAADGLASIGLATAAFLAAGVLQRRNGSLDLRRDLALDSSESLRQ